MKFNQVSQATSHRMKQVRQKNTAPELILRRLLHAEGYRYILHDKRLPGHPDMVFPRRKKVIFVHGCFWHGHICARAKLPKTNVEFWSEKIEKNKARDKSVVAQLRRHGWGVAIVWECSLGHSSIHTTLSRLRTFLKS